MRRTPARDAIVLCSLRGKPCRNPDVLVGRARKARMGRAVWHYAHLRCHRWAIDMRLEYRKQWGDHIRRFKYIPRMTGG